MTFRQAKELKGLPPEQKAEVFHKAVAVAGGKAPKPQTIAKVRRSSFDPDLIPRNNDNAYTRRVSGNDVPRVTIEREDIDPADKMPKATPEDVVSARAVALPPESTLEVFPRVFSFEVHSQEELDSFRVLEKKILVKRGSKNGHAKIDLHDAIAKVCNAYKRVKGRNLSVKPADAAQLRRQLESGTTLEEFIATGEKAWTAKSFWCVNHANQMSTFVKNYDNIREEIENPKLSAVDHQKEAGGLKGQAYAASVRTVGS
jgi:hypothetical protein